MSAAHNATSFHRTVVEDVIKNMRAEFANEGLDDQVLDDLKQLWESKLIQAGVYDFPQQTAPAQNYNTYDINYNYLPETSHVPSASLMPLPTQTTLYTNTHTQMPYLGAPGATNRAAPTAAHLAAMSALRSLNTQQPQHTTLPPASTLTQTSSYGFDSSGKPQQYMAPPGSLAGWNTQPPNANTQYTLPNIKQHDGANDEVDPVKLERQKIDRMLLKKYARKQKQLQTQNQQKDTPIPQFDGLGDRKTSADDDDDEDDEGEAASSPKGDEELGSDLDDDDDDEPDTEHIVLCQYEKVTRVKNKRKANLKDGIMHINGRDYVFSKANGEFDF